MIPDSTLIDLVVGLIQPDIDIDGDGDLDSLARDVLGNGRVSTCLHRGSDVPPLMPWTCALRPEMADGFSLAVEYEAIGAVVVGFGARTQQSQ
jgi:hypothetical protein